MQIRTTRNQTLLMKNEFFDLGLERETAKRLRIQMHMCGVRFLIDSG